jgi:DNA polymerase III subunit delta
MNSTDFFREVQKGKILPCYYFWGPERWLIDEALERIEEKTLSPSTRDFNREVLDATETPAESLLSSLQSFPVRSPRRLVIIRQADPLWRKTPLPFVDYFQDPNPQTCAVFIGEKADMRSKFFQALEKKGAVVPFYPPFEKDLHRWVQTQAEQLGASIAAGAIHLLVERVGSNLREIRTELEKLTLGKASRKRIEEEDILALTEDTRSESPFELPQAVGRRNAREALRLLHKNLQQGEPPILLFNLVVRHLRLIQRARNLRAEGFSKKEVEGKIRIHPRRAEEFWRQAEKFPPSLMNELWKVTLKTDQRLKLSRADKGLLLEDYLFALLREMREAREVPRDPFRKRG